MSTSLSQSSTEYLVSLPMYDWPEQQADNDRFWAQLRTEMMDSGFADLPQNLTRDVAANVWENPRSLLTQTCGFPLVHSLKEKVQLLGTPCYDAPSFKDGYYASVVLVRKDSSATAISDFHQHRVAISSELSQSGCNALRNLFAKDKPSALHSSNKQTMITGSHRESVHAVADKRADLCALDPVSWQLAQRYEACARNLRVLCETDYTPALPLICSAAVASAYAADHDGDVDALPSIIQACWNTAIAATPVVADRLMLCGIKMIERSAYEAVAVGPVS